MIRERLRAESCAQDVLQHVHYQLSANQYSLRAQDRQQLVQWCLRDVERRGLEHRCQRQPELRHLHLRGRVRSLQQRERSGLQRRQLRRHSDVHFGRRRRRVPAPVCPRIRPSQRDAGAQAVRSQPLRRRNDRGHGRQHRVLPIRIRDRSDIESRSLSADRTPSAKFGAGCNRPSRKFLQTTCHYCGGTVFRLLRGRRDHKSRHICGATPTQTLSVRSRHPVETSRVAKRQTHLAKRTVNA